MIGVSAWLVGAVTATAGSMIATSELAHGLLGQQTQQLGGATVSADLDSGSGIASTSPAVSSASSAAASQPAAKVRHARRPSAAASSTAGQNPAGTLLESGDGSVMAACQPGGAYLLYWSPDQGFQADDVFRGPAPVTSVTFRGPAASIVMRVSCAAGVPVAHLYRASSDDGSGSDDSTRRLLAERPPLSLRSCAAHPPVLCSASASAGHEATARRACASSSSESSAAGTIG